MIADIMSDDKHTQRVVSVAFITDEKGRVLLQLRRDTEILDADGKWEFPGGTVEFGESPEETVKREVGEEIGCVIDVVSLLPKIYTHVWTTVDGLNVHSLTSCTVARIVRGVPLPQDPEVVRVEWFTREEIESLDLLPGVKEFLSC
jgi:8-oxo-dGTP diphosphatase